MKILAIGDQESKLLWDFFDKSMLEGIEGGRTQSAHGIPESPDGEDPGRRLADKRANGLPEYQSLRFETGETTVF